MVSSNIVIYIIQNSVGNYFIKINDLSLHSNSINGAYILSNNILADKQSTSNHLLAADPHLEILVNSW